MDDRQIIELYWQRDQSAISETKQKYGCLCYNIARNVLSIHEDAEECVNDTYQQTRLKYNDYEKTVNVP